MLACAIAALATSASAAPAKPIHIARNSFISSPSLREKISSRHHRDRLFASIVGGAKPVRIEIVLRAAHPSQPDGVAARKPDATRHARRHRLSAHAATYERIPAEILDVLDNALHAALERDLDVLGTYAQLPRSEPRLGERGTLGSGDDGT